VSTVFISYPDAVKRVVRETNPKHEAPMTETLPPDG
jgi:hypothetical protein